MYRVPAAASHRPFGWALRVAVAPMLALSIVLLGALPAAAAGDQTAAPLTAAQQRVENVIAAARQYLGIAYRVGSEGPLTFDCSGLVFRSFSDAGLLDRVGGARLRAAGYMRWFATRGLMTADESQAQRGDLIIYGGGKHIGIYLGDGRAISALTSGVSVHSLHGLDLPLTGFLRPDWSGDGAVAPFTPQELPEVPEAPAALVPQAPWLPQIDATTVGPVAREGDEVVSMRTATTRTFANPDGTYTTEFHVQPIYYQPADGSELAAVDLRFTGHAKDSSASVDASPVQLTARPADDAAGFVAVVSGDHSIGLGVASDADMAKSSATPLISADGRAVDYFDWQPHGIGLRLIARTDGFKSFIVLGQRPDRNSFTFVLDAPGMTPVLGEDGSIALLDEAGSVLGRLPRPLLLDSSDDDGNGGAYFSARTSLAVQALDDGRWQLSVSVQRRQLDELVYPAYLDLSLVDFPAPAAGAQLAFVSSGHADASLVEYQRPETPGFAELLLGRQPGARNDNRVYMRFGDLNPTLGTVDVASAALEVLPYIQKGATSTAVVERLAADWNAGTLTWNTQPPAFDAVPRRTPARRRPSGR